MRRFLMRPWMLRLGALSYSTYLIHGTVLFALFHLVWGKLPVIGFIALYFALSYAASELFHWLIDAPAVDLGRYVGRRIPS